MRSNCLLALGFSLLCLLTTGCSVHTWHESSGPVAGPAAVNADPLTSPDGGQLYASLWFRTSAEYEALARQVYSQAWPRVRMLAREARRSNGSKPLAIVMDLDETVFDNSGYQLHLANINSSHTDDLFHEWVSTHIEEIGAVPGAVEFIAKAHENNITPIYITNRGPVVNEATIRTLEHLGISTDGIEDRLMPKTEGSSKEARREAVRAKYNVIAYFGDNLDDFSDDFRRPVAATAADRIANVRKHEEHWGRDWFVLPNPMYGSWMGYVDWNDPAANFDITREQAPAGVR